MFRLAMSAVTLYVQADQLNEKSILKNLMNGKSFIVFEGLGVASDFSFKAEFPVSMGHSGHQFKTATSRSFSVKAPHAEKIHMIRNGQLIVDVNGESLKSDHDEVGAYRVEVYRKNKLWIITNPIYVKGKERKRNY